MKTPAEFIRRQPRLWLVPCLLLALAANVLGAGQDFLFFLDSQSKLWLASARVVQTGQFSSDTNWQTIKFSIPVECRYFCLSALSSQDGRPYAAVAELELLDAAGEPLDRSEWRLAYADSEESERENDWAENVFDGRPETYWHTRWTRSSPDFPHRIILDLGSRVTLAGFRYLPRQGDAAAPGRIRDYQICVADRFQKKNPPMDALPENIFLFSYFTDYGEDGLHLAWSMDGYDWQPLNRGRSLLSPGLGGTNLIRDPCLLRGPDDIFRVVWTCAWTGDSIGYSWSKDLIHWSPPEALPVMASESGAHNCWAPEIYWDEKNTNYLIIWASAVRGHFAETENQNDPDDNQRLYFTTTKDFKTFSRTAVFYDPGFSLIDPVILPANGRHYLCFKDETAHPEAKRLRLSVGDSWQGPFHALGQPFSPEWVEGPALYAAGRDYVCLFHFNGNNAWGALKTADFEHWTDVSERLNLPFNSHSGTVLQIPRDMLGDLWRAGVADIGPAAEAADLDLGAWIWTETVADKQTCRLWRSFTVPVGTLVSHAVLRITADNGYRVFLDGREVGRGGDFNGLTEYDLTQLISSGSHVLAVEAFNDALAAGVIAGLRVQLLSGQTVEVLSGPSWRVVPADEKNWTTRKVSSANWKPARIVGFAGKFEWQRPKRILQSPPLLPQQIHFWQRGWFMFTLLTISALVLIFSIRQGLKLAVHARSHRMLERERDRIARDMHDELGSGLTQLTLLGELVLRESAPNGDARKRLNDLCAKSRSLLRSMDEIVWTVNPRRDTVKDFAAFISEHAQEYLASTAIHCRQEVAEELPDVPLDLPQRRNLLLAVKEAIRNAARHSGADEVNLKLRVAENVLEVVVEDNGRGFAPGNTQTGRNGMLNMKRRLADVGGSFELKAAPGKGCRVTFRLPIGSPKSKV